MSHAILSPSSASRWLTCTPSARLEKQFPDKSGAAAAEGTLAHAIAELVVRQKVLFEFGLNELEKKVNAVVAELDPEGRFFSPAMLEHCDEYAFFVRDRYVEACKINSDAHVFTETQVDLTAYIPEGFGTVDVRIICDGTLDIIDLKYGKGVLVSAQENKQLMVYALGALEESELLFDIHTVRATIYQPRISNYSTWEISVADLKAWGNTFLKEQAAKAFAGEGERVAGSHCKFCKAAATCRALADHNLGAAGLEFKDITVDAPLPLEPTPAAISPEEIVALLQRKDEITSWLNTVEAYALDAAINNGVRWPGMKLVEGRSNRCYSNEAEVVKALTKAAVPEDKIYKPRELQGITALTKSLGAKPFKAIVEPLLVKPPGKPTLVPESDQRTELNTAEAAIADFADVE